MGRGVDLGERRYLGKLSEWREGNCSQDVSYERRTYFQFQKRERKRKENSIHSFKKKERKIKLIRYQVD